MSARKLHGAWWIDFRHNGVRYRKRSPRSTRAGAVVYEAYYRSRLAAGEDPAKRIDVPIFADYSRTWLHTWVRVNNKRSEYSHKECLLRVHLTPAFGKLRLDTITADRIEAFKCRKVDAGQAPASINLMLSTLGRCLRIAYESDLIPKVPRIRKLRLPPADSDFLTVDEAARLLAGFQDPRWRQLALLALRTGMRIGELLALRWASVDLSAGRLLVRESVYDGHVDTPKSNRTRHIPLTRDAIAALRELRGERIPIGDGLVLGRPDGSHHTYSAARSKLKRAVRAAGLPHFGWHRLRHTFASHLAGRSVSMRVIQALMGHASVTTTERYAHLAPSVLDDAVRLLEQPVSLPSVGLPAVGQLAVNTAPGTPSPAPSTSKTQLMLAKTHR